MTILETLKQGSKNAELISRPSLVEDIYQNVPEEAELDRLHSIDALERQVGMLDFPVISINGPFSSGKTFLVEHLMQSGILESHIAPTTSSVTVFRHTSTRPESWPADCTVFALKPGVDPRTLSPDAIAEAGTYDDLSRLTTYNQEAPHDVVVVFHLADVLKKIVLIDCPGIGTLAEAPQPELSWHREIANELNPASRTQEQTVREHLLLAMAMRCSDSFVVLSSMTGNTGGFSDRSTALVLAELAKHVERFPNERTHSNILFVGSQADPTRAGLQNEEVALEVARNAIFNQVDRLPPALAAKIDKNALAERIVLYFALDPVQQELGIQEMIELVQSFRPDSSQDDLRKEAAMRFEARVESKVRIKAFHAGFNIMTDKMLEGMEGLRMKSAEEGLTLVAEHHAGKQAVFASRSAAKYEMEDLSTKYRREEDERQSSWSSIKSRGRADMQTAADRALTEFKKEYSLWEDKSYLEAFLTEQYTDKEQARQFAPLYIQDVLSGGLRNAMTSQVRNVEERVLGDLKAFDTAYLRGTQSNLCSIDGLSSLDAQQKLVPLSTVSAFSTFTAITAGIAGGTTLLAVAGSSLATAALAKLVLLGVTVAGAVGVGAAVSGLLLGIPVYGWVLLGLGGLWKLFRFCTTPWQTQMAEAIAKSARSNRSEVADRASETISSFFQTANTLLSETLETTEAIIAGHISQVHDIAAGSVRSQDLREAAAFYASQEAVARETMQTLHNTPETEAIAA